MANLMQLLLEALRANVQDRNIGSRPDENQLSDEMSGFILENVKVATTPFIEYEGDDAQDPNPLAQLLHNREKSGRVKKPENINKILDHIVRLEKKVKVLERIIPTNKFQQRVWLAPATVSDDDPSNEESDYYPEDSFEESEHAGLKHSGSQRGSRNSKSITPRNSKSRGSPRTSPPGKKLSRVETRQIRLEKEDKSCFARLLFSRCWTGKDHAAGWKIKRKCPTGHKLSMSCPCGDIGPCHKVKLNACPIDKITSSKKKNTLTTASPQGSKASRKEKASNDHKKNTTSSSKQPKAKAAKPNGKPLIEKLFPCCFKEHMHGDCCCRCKDKPALPDQKHSKQDDEKSVSKALSAAPSAKASGSESGTISRDYSARPSDATEDEGGIGSYHSESEYRTFNIGSIPVGPTNIYEESSRTSQKLARGDRNRTSRRKESAPKRYKRKDKKEDRTTQRPDNLNSLPVKPMKSTTSFQIMLHPDLSNDRIVEPEVVSHQILKTLSTIHGPVKVEQKIVVQGNGNSVVIVTHGEACQCNLCQMLKSRMHPKELVDGLSPQVVKISTHNGCNTLISHNDGCSCALCRVIDPAMTNEGENRIRELENTNLVVAAASSSNDKGSGEKSTPANAVQTLHSNVTQAIPTALEADLENSRNTAYRTLSLIKKMKRQSIYGKKKAKKCKCTKCRQRRRVDKLKLRLKKEMGAEEYDKILREITNSNVSDCKPKVTSSRTCKQKKPSIDTYSDDDSAEPGRKKKSVSFSDDSNSKRHARIGRIDSYERSNTEKMKCKLCEVVGNTKPEDETFKKKKYTHTSRSSKNRPSTVFSMSESSHKSPDDKINDQLMSESIGSENEPYQLTSEEQNCFPTGHMPKDSTKKRFKDRTTEGFQFIGEDTPTVYLRREGSCSGGCWRRGSVGNVIRQGKEQSTILLSDGAFPPKFVYWSPESRSNVATAYSSDSYYLPDQDEFPIVNTECEDSVPSSKMNTNLGGAPSLHRVHIPVWFRMMPDRKAS